LPVIKKILAAGLILALLTFPRLSLAQGFQRIISLYPAHTENLAWMGAASQLVGVSRSCDYPPEVLALPRFSPRDDPEKFLAFHPDLVLVRPMIERSYPDLINRLRQAAIEVVSLQPTSVAGIFDYWQQLGRLAGREQEARSMVRAFKRELARIREEVAAVPVERRPRVYFEAIHAKMKTFAPQSIAAFVLAEAGGVNVALDASRVRNTNIAWYGKERLLEKADRIDVFLAQVGRMNPVTVEEIIREPGFAAIKAVREGRVFLVDERLVSRPTMRLLDGIRQVHALLYPGLGEGT